jgi:5-(carboxyamino)imidazole ribonucleotide mutase
LFNSLANGEIPMPDVLIVMGSQSDAGTMKHARDTLDDLGITHDERITSAHRTPERMVEVIKGAEGEGFKVIIAGAGGSAHLPGMAASETILPVYAVVPQSSSSILNDIAGVFSNIQMPAGVPLGYLGLSKAGATNAALLAARTLALADPELRERLRAWIANQADAVPKKPDFTKV